MTCNDPSRMDDLRVLRGFSQFDGALDVLDRAAFSPRETHHRAVVVRLRDQVVAGAGLGLLDEGVGETNRLVPFASPVAGLDQVSIGPTKDDDLAARARHVSGEE